MGVMLPDPFIRKGEPIRADALCDLARAAQRRSLSIGEYSSATLNLKRAIKGGRGGTINFIFGRTVGITDPAGDWALTDAAAGRFQPLGDDGLADGPEIDFLNRYFDEIPDNVPGFVNSQTGVLVPIGVNFGCNAGPVGD